MKKVFNFNADANTDDGICDADEVVGCTNETALTII